MKLIMEVEGCADCPCLQRSDSVYGYVNFTCGHPDMQNKSRDLDERERIPHWCPIIHQESKT